MRDAKQLTSAYPSAKLVLLNASPVKFCVKEQEIVILVVKILTSVDLKLQMLMVSRVQMIRHLMVVPSIVVSLTLCAPWQHLLLDVRKRKRA
jgi:hypothetical protein